MLIRLFEANEENLELIHKDSGYTKQQIIINKQKSKR
jgi:hypothetical protein